mgnify:CR=1 FL=1
MKLVIAATPKVAIPAIELLRKSNQVTIVTQPDKPSGRGKHLKPSDIAAHYPESHKPLNDEELSGLLSDSDLLITIGFGKLLSNKILDIPRYGGINLHFSLLPRWRGAAPVQRAIEAGDKLTGVTIFQMDSGMDTGPIWVQKEFAIQYGMDSIELFSELSHLGATALETAIEIIKAGAIPTPQSGAPTIAKKVTKAECAIVWNDDSEKIIRKIKAFAFNPGVTARIRGQLVKIEDARISINKLPSGQLNSKGEVGTRDGSIVLLKVTPAGKRTMTAQEWLNGFKPQVGECFE